MGRIINRFIKIIVCLLLLMVTILPLRSVYADDSVPGMDDVQEDSDNNKDNQNTDILPSSEEDNQHDNDRRMFTIVAPDPFPATATYNFFLSEDDSTPYATQYVKNGDVLLSPETPAAPNASSMFVGWFMKGSDTPFTNFGTVSGVSEDQTLNLYARFSKSILIKYADVNGSIIHTEIAVSGQKIEIMSDYPEVDADHVTKQHVGWSLVQGSFEDVSGFMTVGDQDITLYPICKEGHWVHFESNGGSAFPGQFVVVNADNKKAKNPGEPIKDGYSFTGWYIDEDTTELYDFNEDVTDTLTLYAGYELQKVKYCVLYYAERQVSIEPKKEDGGTWEYKLIASEMREGFPGDKAEYDEELVFTPTYNLEKLGYEIDTEKTVDVEISEDGKSIYKVYYTPKYFTLKLTDIPDRDGVLYDIEITDRYTADLTYMWEYMETKSDMDKLFDGLHMFWIPLSTGGGRMIQNAYEYIHMDDANYVGKYQTRGANNVANRYFFETLEGKAPNEHDKIYENTSVRIQYGTVTDDRTYYLYKEGAGTGGWNRLQGELEYKEAAGFTCAWQLSDGNVAYYTADGTRRLGFWYHCKAYYGVTNEWGKAPYYEFNHGWPYTDPDKDYEATGELVFEKDGYLDIYYTRNQYKLCFHENLPNGVDQSLLIDDSNVYYEKKLTEFAPKNYVVGETTVIDRNGRPYIFDGWYSMEFYSDATRFDFDSTMPAHDVNLYAHWVTPTFKVEFDTDGGSPVADVTDILYGDKVDRPEDPTKNGVHFIGWTLDGVPYHFASKITKNIVLKAEWGTNTAHTVTYKLNGGSGTAPVDNNAYHKNTIHRVLSTNGMIDPKGKVFVGWTPDEGQTIYYPGGLFLMPDDSVVMYAVWSDSAKITSFTYNYNFDQFGIVDDGETKRTITQVKNNQRVEFVDFISLREYPDGYVFTGWYIDKECKNGPHTMAQVDIINEENNIVYAGWIDRELCPFTITFDLNGGTLDDETGPITLTKLYGDEISIIKAPVRNGYAFTYWQGSKYYPGETYIVRGDHTFVAQWKKTDNPTKKYDIPKTGIE